MGAVMTEHSDEKRPTRLITVWHMHVGKYGDPKAMSTFYITCKPLWFWEEYQP